MPDELEDGYLRVALWREGRRTWMRLNRLVLLAFIGSPPGDGWEAAHIEPEKRDCRLSNLQWELRASNQQELLERRRDALDILMECNWAV